MKKRILAILLMVAMMLPMFPTGIFAAEIIASGKCGENVTWELDSDGVLTISGSGDMKDYTYANGYGQKPGYYGWRVKKAIVKNGVTSIGSSAFYSCFSLTSITIPDSVTSIGDYAFGRCTGLTSITIPDSITSIRYSAFGGCTGLTSITIPDGVTSIAEYAFYGCEKLVNLVVDKENSVYYSEGNCIIKKATKKLIIGCNASIIPSGVISIGYYAFGGCTGLTSITIPDSVRSIDIYAFGGCTGLTSITIPDSVTSIEICAFYDCTSLTSITIPVGVTRIERNAFYGCEKLVNLVVDKENSVYYSEGNCIIKKATKELIIGCNASIIPSGVTSIGDSAFYACTGLTSITIPDSVTSIADYAFYWCNGLTSVTIPDSVTSIGDHAFYWCNGLTSVTISDSVTSIGDYAFNNCTGLTSVTISDSVTSIGDYAFNNCTGLTDVYYTGTEEQWNKIYIGSDNRDLKGATIHFNSTGPDLAENRGNIRLFTSWDAKNQVAYFGDFDLLGCKVTEKTETSFLANVENLIGKYVWVESEPAGNGMVDSAILLCIKEVETRTGTVSFADTSKIIIDGTAYTTPKSVSLPGIFENEFVRYYLSLDGELLGLELTDGSGNNGNDTGNDNKPNGGNDDSHNKDNYNLRVYSIDGSTSVEKGDTFSIVCSLYNNDICVLDWNDPTFSIAESNIFSVTKCEKIDAGYRLTIKGLSKGTSTLIITDAQSGTYIAVDISVLDDYERPLGYTIDSVPSYYPNAFGDDEILTNFYNVNGLYIRNFPNKVALENGKYHLKFDVYNSKYMCGSVDIYDKNGNWIESHCIDKNKNITGIVEVLDKGWRFIKDAFSLRTMSYTAATFTAHTPIDIYVPEGGYIVISNNYTRSPGVYLYNSLDLLLQEATIILDLAVNNEQIEEIHKKTFEEVLKSQAFIDAFRKEFYNISTKACVEAIEFGYAESIDVITSHTAEMLEDIGLDFWGIVSSVLGVGEGILLSAMPSVAKIPMEFIFASSKATNIVAQAHDVFTSSNTEYIVLYTPNNDSHMIVDGISASYDQNAFSEKAVMQVFRIADTDALIVSQNGLVIDSYDLYNICFTVDNLKVQPNGKVLIKIPVQDKKYEDGCIVLHQQDDGAWRVIESKLQNGFVVFEVDHFSNFAIAKSQKSIDDDDATNNPNTDTDFDEPDLNHDGEQSIDKNKSDYCIWFLVFIAVIIMAAVIGFIVIKKKKH